MMQTSAATAGLQSGGGGEHLDDEVSVGFLGVNVLVKVGFAGLDGGLNVLQAVAALLHVALNLPRELDLGRDVEVDLVVAQLRHALVEEGVEALDDEHLHATHPSPLATMW